MMMGTYARKKKSKIILPQLQAQNELIKGSEAHEQTLLREIRIIDSIVKTENITQINGLLFTCEIKNRLAGDLLDCLNKKHNLITYGFDPGSLMLADKNSLHLKESTFSAKLQARCLDSIHQYETQKNKEKKGFEYKKWRIESIEKEGLKRRHSKQRHSEQLLYPHRPISKEKNVSSLKLTDRIRTEISTFSEENHLFDIEQMLSRLKGTVVTIWLPPKTYPSFYGLAVLTKCPKKQSTVRINKYIMFKQGISIKLFESLLVYCQKYMGQEVSELQMIVSREDYRCLLERCGWKMKGSIGVDRMLCLFENQSNKSI